MAEIAKFNVHQIFQLYVVKRVFSDTNFEIGKPCQRFDWMLQTSSGWWRLKHSVEKLARFSDLKVGVRELSSLFMHEPTEKQPLQV